MQAPNNKTLTLYGWTDKKEVRISGRMLRSKAFIDLNNTAKYVLMLFLYRRTWYKDGKGKNSRIRYHNNGLKFTYTEAEQVWGIIPRTFKNALNQLIERGFIRVESSGGTLRGNRECSEYRLIDNWQQFGTPGYLKPEIPKAVCYSKSLQKINADRAMSRKSLSSTDNNVSGQLTKKSVERADMDD